MVAALKKAKNKSFFLRQLIRNYELILFCVPAVVIIFLFNYIPMYGVQIAFRNFSPVLGFWHSPWVGLRHFERFFNSARSIEIIRNTVLISVYTLIWSFPAPIILALLLNQMRFPKYKRIVQTVTYMPYFISIVVLIGMMNLFLSPTRGMYGVFMGMLGIMSPRNPISDPGLFRTIHVGSHIWQTTGFISIIYLAGLSGVDPTFYEAATIDGATRFQKLRYIDFPYILPTAIILFILACGNIMNVGFEKTFLMQNQVNLSVSEVISTYVYKVGLEGGQFSFSTAVNLFNTAINVLLLITVNFVSVKVTKSGLL